jgi:hypothetical protein
VLLKILTIAEACPDCSLQTPASSFEINFGFKESQNSKMDRVRSTARVSREGDDVETTEIAPISEMMRRSGLVTSEKVISEGEAAEAEHIAAEDGSDDEAEEDYNILSPSKPSHIEFGKSTVGHLFSKALNQEQGNTNVND